MPGGKKESGEDARARVALRQRVGRCPMIFVQRGGKEAAAGLGKCMRDDVHEVRRSKGRSQIGWAVGLRTSRLVKGPGRGRGKTSEMTWEKKKRAVGEKGTGRKERAAPLPPRDAHFH